VCHSACTASSSPAKPLSGRPSTAASVDSHVSRGYKNEQGVSGDAFDRLHATARHSSNLTPHTSHLTPHTSHLSHGNSSRNHASPSRNSSPSQGLGSAVLFTPAGYSRVMMMNDDNADDENDETLDILSPHQQEVAYLRLPPPKHPLSPCLFHQSPPSNSTFRNLIQNAPLLSLRPHLRASSWK
jgi:hypothetical protein